MWISGKRLFWSATWLLMLRGAGHISPTRKRGRPGCAAPCLRRGLVLLGMLSAVISVAAQAPARLSERGVDLVGLKSGSGLLGVIVGRENAPQVTLIVQRQWLRHAAPELYATEAAREAADAKAAREQLRDRIQEWKRKRAADQRLVAFLRLEEERIQKRLDQRDAAIESQLMLLEIPHDHIRRTFLQTPQRRQVALLAWRERLTDVETRTAADLQAELRKLDAVQDAVVDLSDRLPTRPQSDREWAARKALIEHAFRQPIDFQGTGDLLVRTDAEAKRPDLTQLLSGVLQQQVGQLLGDPLATKPNPHRWRDLAAKGAAEAGAEGVRVTRVSHDVAAGRVSVEQSFLARMPNGTWETVWTLTDARDTRTPRPELEQRIRHDPQVGQIEAAAKALGLDVSDLAVRFGAATMEAQDAADAAFFACRDRYLTRLDTPPLTWRE